MLSSAGEHLVHTEGVAGSIPAASTISPNTLLNRERDATVSMREPDLLVAGLQAGKRSLRTPAMGG
jgi:hypothetical protein